MFLEGYWEERGFPPWLCPLLVPDPSHLATVTLQPATVTVLDHVTLKLRLTVGSRGLPQGTLINCLWIGAHVLPPFQDSQPGAANYVTSRVNGQANEHLSLWWEPIMQVICLGPLETRLHEGDVVDAIIGDKSGGGSGLQLHDFSFSAPFQVWLKLPGSDQYTTLPHRPLLTVKARPAAALRVLTPSIAHHSRPLEARISAVDSSGNVDAGFAGPLTVRGDDLEEGHAILSQDRGQIRVALSPSRAQGERVRITASSPGSSLQGANNPTLLEQEPEGLQEEPEGLQIYWGDVHGHTALSTIAAFDPDHFFCYAREESQLDFTSLTDSDHFMSPERWAITREATTRHHVPGEFVTFLGFEWSSGSLRTAGKAYYGHKTVLYPTDVGRCLPYTEEPYETPEGLWAHLEGTGALTIPHHPAYPFDWENVSGCDWRHHDPSMQRLVEIYSRHGCSECVGCARPVLDKQNTPRTWAPGTVQHALSLGYRLGFIASSDTQIGKPGHPFREPKPTSHYRGGLTAVFARERTREAVWEGLCSRHCYGTTGPRIVMQFCINGHMMGEEVTLSREEPRRIEATVLGTEQIRRLVLIKNNEVFYEHRCVSDTERLAYVDSAPLQETTYYYLRAEQADGELAWASPIWCVPSQ